MDLGLLRDILIVDWPKLCSLIVGKIQIGSDELLFFRTQVLPQKLNILIRYLRIVLGAR